MTRIYFVRHAQPDKSVIDDRTRPLTQKGLTDSALVIDILKDKGIDIAICSPYKRSLDTIKGFTESQGLKIQTDEHFRERESSVQGQGLRKNPERWKSKEWNPEWGESIESVRSRNIEALMEVLDKYKGHNIVLGTHGTALSTILDYLSPVYGYDDFIKMMDWMPNIVEVVFEGKEVIEINELGHIEI